MSVLQNINGTLYRMDASDLSQLAAVDTEGILGGTPGATTNGQTLVDQLAADDVQAQTDIGQIKTDLSDYHVIPSKNLFSEIKTGVFLWGSAQDGYNVGTATNGFVAIGAVETGEQYVVTKNNVGNRFRLVLFKDYPTSTSDLTAALVYDSNGATDYTFTVPSGGYKYLVGGFNNTDAYSGDIQPMLCTAADYAANPSYEPYFLPMRDGKLDIADEQFLGAWNLFFLTLQTNTQDNVVWTANADKTVTANGTTSADSRITIGKVNLAQGNYFLSGCPTPTGIYDWRLRLSKTVNGVEQVVWHDGGDATPFSVSSAYEGEWKLEIRYAPNKVMSNILFKPMVSLKPNMPYAPYAMTNRELTEVKTVYNQSNILITRQANVVCMQFNGCTPAAIAALNLSTLGILPMSIFSTFHCRCDRKPTSIEFNANGTILNVGYYANYGDSFTDLKTNTSTSVNGTITYICK